MLPRASKITYFLLGPEVAEEVLAPEVEQNVAQAERAVFHNTFFPHVELAHILH